MSVSSSLKRTSSQQLHFLDNAFSLQRGKKSQSYQIRYLQLVLDNYLAGIKEKTYGYGEELAKRGLAFFLDYCGQILQVEKESAGLISARFMIHAEIELGKKSCIESEQPDAMELWLNDFAMRANQIARLQMALFAITEKKAYFHRRFLQYNKLPDKNDKARAYQNAENSAEKLYQDLNKISIDYLMGRIESKKLLKIRAMDAIKLTRTELDKHREGKELVVNILFCLGLALSVVGYVAAAAHQQRFFPKITVATDTGEKLNEIKQVIATL